MGYDAEHLCGGSTDFAGGTSGVAQFAFVLRDHALDVPAASISLCREAVVHAFAITSARPGVMISWIDRNDGERDTQFFTTESMVSLRVIRCVCHQPMDLQMSNRWQSETVFSMIKRNLGSALRSRSYWAQCRELGLIVLTHNIMIILSRTGFLQSIPDPFNPPHAGFGRE